MMLIDRNKCIKLLIEELETFEDLAKNEGVITRIKNAPAQLMMYGLLPYITFLVSKYGSSSEGYTSFLNFLVYLLGKNKLGLININFKKEYLKEKKDDLIKEFLREIHNLKEPELKILERNMFILLEEMKKIYAGIFKEQRQKP